jgi:hypothetical protein
MHFLNCDVCISYRLDKPEGDISEDPRSVIEDLTEAPNPGSKIFSVDISDPSPTSEGKPRT